MSRDEIVQRLEAWRDRHAVLLDAHEALHQLTGAGADCGVRTLRQLARVIAWRA